jgi:hypothetical protein
MAAFRARRLGLVGDLVDQGDGDPDLTHPVGQSQGALARGPDVELGLLQVVAGGVGLGGDPVDRLGDRGGRPGQLIHRGRRLGDPAGLLGGGVGQPLHDGRQLVDVAPDVDPGRVERPGDVPQDEADEQGRQRDRTQRDQDRHQDGRACAGGGPLGHGDHRQGGDEHPDQQGEIPLHRHPHSSSRLGPIPTCAIGFRRGRLSRRSR